MNPTAGFLAAYLAALFGAPLWVGALLTSIPLGLAHAYQGAVGVLRSGAAGLLLAVLYLLTGALWAPMVTHTLMDLTAGRMGFASASDPESMGTSSEAAA